MFDRTAILPVILALGVAMLISFALTPLVMRLAHKIGAIDIPKDERRMHNKPIPRLGGLAIFLGCVVSILLFAELTAQLRGILIGATIIVSVGIVDDVRPLGAGVKLILQILSALVAVSNGVAYRRKGFLHGIRNLLRMQPGLWQSAGP